MRSCIYKNGEQPNRTLTHTQIHAFHIFRLDRKRFFSFCREFVLHSLARSHQQEWKQKWPDAVSWIESYVACEKLIWYNISVISGSFISFRWKICVVPLCPVVTARKALSVQDTITCSLDRMQFQMSEYWNFQGSINRVDFAIWLTLTSKMDAKLKFCGMNYAHSHTPFLAQYNARKNQTNAYSRWSAIHV